MKEEIIETTFDKWNDLVARFMGARWRTWEDNKAPLYRFDEPIGKQYAFHHTELQYHTSWDWLMPVVEKIENIHGIKFLDVDTFDDKPAAFAVHIFKRCCDIQIDNIMDDHIIEVTAAESKIKAVYDAVLQFIHWYNTNKK